MRVALFRITLAATAAALLGACGDDPAAPERFDPRGSLGFSYTGTRTGTYEAAGELTLALGLFEPFLPGGGSAPTLPQLGGVGAAAIRQNGQTIVMAYRPTVAPKGDLFVLVAGQVTGAGELSINPLGCSDATPGACRTGVLFPDLDPTALLDVDGAPTDLLESVYVLTTGTIAVTAVSDLRVRGTFSGLAIRASSGTGLPFGAITITNGTFDVPVRAQ